MAGISLTGYTTDLCFFLNHVHKQFQMAIAKIEKYFEEPKA